MMGKYGRVGDIPIIGAGTYADNNGAAVSCTGHGEYYIRNNVAFQVNARFQYQGLTLSRVRVSHFWCAQLRCRKWRFDCT